VTYDSGQVEFTAAGSLLMDRALADSRFPGGTLAARLRERELWLYPLHSPTAGGLLLKQRNAAGDRSVLIREVLEPREVVGPRPAFWDARRAVLRVALDDAAEEAPDDGSRG
jgi:hydrogenase maturation protease